MIKTFLFAFFTRLVPTFVLVLMVLLVIRRELYEHYGVTLNSLVWLITLIFTYFVLVNLTLGNVLRGLKHEMKIRREVSSVRTTESEAPKELAKGEVNMTLRTRILASMLVVGLLLFSIWAMLFGKNASIRFSTIVLVAVVALLIVGILWSLITAIRKSTRES